MVSEPPDGSGSTSPCDCIPTTSGRGVVGSIPSGAGSVPGVQVTRPLGSTTIFRPVQSAAVGDRTAAVWNLWESAGAPDPDRVIETMRQQAPPGFSPTPIRRRFRSSLPMFAFLCVLRSMEPDELIPKHQPT